MSGIKPDPHLWMQRRPEWGERKREPDMERCRASVGAGSRAMKFNQCTRKGRLPYTMRDGTEVLLCKQHHPDTVAAREAEREAKWKAIWDAAENGSAHKDESGRLAKWLLKECIAATKSGSLPGSVVVVVDAILQHEKAAK